VNLLIVVDMQNDFIDGVLGTKEAQTILPRVIEKIKSWDGKVLYTMDTHNADYLDTQEGRNLPVEHCIKGTQGWNIQEDIAKLIKTQPIEKLSFGSSKLGDILLELDDKDKINSITFIGLCTDICVISNAMIAKAYLSEVPIIVDASCCAGITPNSHKQALEAMKVCQIMIKD